MLDKACLTNIQARDLTGKQLDLENVAERVALVINVSNAGNQTPQNITWYNELARLSEEYRADGFTVIACPCSQFGASKASVAEALRFYKRLGVEFTVMEDSNVNGEDAHDLYRMLKAGGPDIRGNFQTAFLVAARGGHYVVQRFDALPPRALRSRVEALLVGADLPSLQTSLKTRIEDSY